MKRPVDILKIPNEVFFDEVRNILASGQSVTLRATGRSMTPTFRDSADTVTVSPCLYNELEIGDVVLFDRGDTICLHRIIGKKDKCLTIRGDGNSHSALEYATADKVIGKVTGGTMKGGRSFTVDDEQWKRNTRLILKYHLPLSIVHRLFALLKSYPFSIFIMAVVLFLSFFNPGKPKLPEVDNLDKMVHMLMYCGLSSVFWFDWLRRRKLDRRAVVLGIVYCFALPVAIGGLIELGQQYLVTYRDGDWADFLANTIGCLLALPITFFFTVHFIERLNKRNSIWEKD